MKNTDKIQNWYYVIIQEPGTPSEQFVGFTDDKASEKFLPAFKTQQDAKACFSLMPKDIFNQKYELQAIIEEDLLNLAAEYGHKIYLLDEKGSILNHLN